MGAFDVKWSIGGATYLFLAAKSLTIHEYVQMTQSIGCLQDDNVVFPDDWLLVGDLADMLRQLLAGKGQRSLIR